MANQITYLELHSQSPSQAKEFYSQLFDWKTSDISFQPPGQPKMTYTEIKTGAGIGAGLMQQQQPGAPSSWLAYVSVGDLAAANKKAKDLGAKVLVEREEVKGMGIFSIIQDPTGARLGLWQALEAK